MTSDGMTQSVLRDRYGRIVTYLRVSITDRCNLRCFYCLPRDCGLSRATEQLSFDELAAVVSAGVSLGINKIRITGGEPLVRPGVVEFVRTLRSLPGITDLALSTNGTLLSEYAMALKAAGLMRINISLDSVRPTVFRAISGRNDLDRVCAGIAAARAAGLHPIKLNVVVMRGVNDDELPAILEFAAEQGAQVRFIEYMPLGVGQRWESSYVSRAEILERIRPHLMAEEPPRRQPGDTATYYVLGTGGDVGIISPVSCRFCDLCNRLRLTADGKLRPCLTLEGEVDLHHALRPRVSRDALVECFHTAVAGRPEMGRYRTAESGASSTTPRPMAAIGG
ncbi:MAG: GTP 3',8-cyclase MoaA [Candidatus Binatia bacterium]